MVEALQSKEKGRRLEIAVKFIIEAILESDPDHRGSRFTIETRKIEKVADVRHEIDVLVKTISSVDFSSTWIFECKNWEEPVGKNEVIILAEKVEAVSATRGFLVAKSLTKDAEAQLQLKPRLKFIRCTEDFLSPLNFLELVHYEFEVLRTAVIITWRGGAALSHPVEINHVTVSCVFNGRPINLLSFIESQIFKTVDVGQKEQAAKIKNEGVHWLDTGCLLKFLPGEFLIDGFEVESLSIPVCCFITSRRRKIISKFELESRGQMFAFEPIEQEDGKPPIEIQIVATFCRSSQKAIHFSS